MIFGLLSLVFMVVPVAVLGWRLVVSKTRTTWIRVGAAAAAMTTVVGAVALMPRVTDFHFADWRDDFALAASLTGSAYLLVWALRKHSNRRHRTMSIIAACIGFAPAIAIALNALFFPVQP
jgi:hypothetical protein